MAKKFLLHSKEDYGIYSSWTEYLYCSILKNGSMTLRYNVKSEYGSEWSPSIKNIRRPKEFIDAFESIERFNYLSLEELLPSLHLHHPIFAIRLEHLLKIQEVEDELETTISVLLDNFMKEVKLEDLPTGITNMRVFNNNVKNYVRDFLETTGNFPKGKHKIYGREVFFP